MTKFKNLKKVIINPRFLYTLPLASVGLISTQQNTNAMFNPRNYNPRIRYFYATETRHSLGIISTKTTPTTSRINTKPSSITNPNPNTKSSPIIFSHISSKISDKHKNTKPNYVSTLNVNLNNKQTPTTKENHVSTFSINLNSKSKTPDTKPVTPQVKPKHTSTLSISLNAKTKPTPKSETKASDLPKLEVTPTPKPYDLGARPKTAAPKYYDSETSPKIDLKPVTYVTTGLEAKRKSSTTASENKSEPKFAFKIEPPTKPHSEFLVPDGTHTINGRIDVKPDVPPEHYTPQNSIFLDMLRARFKPVSQSAPDNYTTQPNQSNEKTSSNSAQQTKTSTSNALQNKNPEVEPDITPIYDSQSQKTIKKVSDKFEEKIKDLSKSTLKNELKNQNKVNRPYLKETVNFKTKVNKLSKDTLKNQIDKHLSGRIFKENAKIERASENFGNVMENIAYANLESYLENNNKKGKSSKEIKSLSKDFGKSMGTIASKEFSVRLSNLNELLK